MRNFLAGTATVTIDGVSVMVEGGFKYSTTTRERSSLSGMDGVHGYKEIHTPAYIEMTIRDGGLSLEDFNDQVDVTVSAQLANGKTVVGSNMWLVGKPEVNSEEATFTARFEGREVVEY